MANIQGKDDVLMLSSDSGTTWKTLVCETSHTFNFTRNSTTTATKCDSGTSARSLGAYEWSFQSSVVVKTDPGATEISFEDLLSLSVAGTGVLIRSANPNPAGTNFYISGTVYITDLSKTAETDGLVSADVTFSGDGALDISA
jgi:TP901-1 family phage major tail protein